MARQTSPIKSIRLHCIDCCGGVTRGEESPSGCPDRKCALWPFRMGKNPFHAQASKATRRQAATLVQGSME